MNTQQILHNAPGDFTLEQQIRQLWKGTAQLPDTLDTFDHSDLESQPVLLSIFGFVFKYRGSNIPAWTDAAQVTEIDHINKIFAADFLAGISLPVNQPEHLRENETRGIHQFAAGLTSAAFRNLIPQSVRSCHFVSLSLLSLSFTFNIPNHFYF
jgi:hypothetical protein